MDFREIEYVLAIMKCQTLSGAARMLDITQPSLSKFLHGLEKRLNTPLFKRVENKMYLTYAGQQYVDTGLKILDLNRQLHHTLADLTAEVSGLISVGITPTRGRYVLPHVLPAFKKQYPKYEINIVEDGVNGLNQALELGQIDLALYTVYEPQPQNIVYEYICQEEVVLCISPSNPHSSLIKAVDGRKHPWIDMNQLGSDLFLMVDEKFRTRKIANRILAASPIRPRTITLQSVETVLSLVAADVGVGFCTDMCERFFYPPDPLLFCSAGPDQNLWDFVIAYKKGSYLPAAAQSFIQITKTCFSA